MRGTRLSNRREYIAALAPQTIARHHVERREKLVAAEPQIEANSLHVLDYLGQIRAVN